MRRTTHYILVLFLLAFALTPAAGFAAKGALADIAPEETLLYLEVRDINALGEKWNATPFYRLWTHTRFEPFFKPVKEVLRTEIATAEKNLSMSFKELRSFFTGEMALFLSDIRYMTENTPQGLQLFHETNRGFMARVRGDRGKIKKLIEDQILGKDLPIHTDRSVATFKNVKIYTTVFRKVVSPWEARRAEENNDPGVRAPTTLRDPINPGTAEYHYEYAFVDDLCIVLEGQSAFMKKILSNYFDVKEGRKASLSLASTRNYRQVFAPGSDTPDIVGYANFERLYERNLEDPVFKFRMERMSALELGAFKSGAVAVRFRPKALEVEATVRTSPSPKGLAGLLVGERRNAFRSQRLTLRDTDEYNSILVDIPELYRLAGAYYGGPVSGPSSFLESFESLIERETGIRFREDILNSLGTEVVMFGRERGGEGSGSSTGSGGGKNISIYMVELSREEEFAQNYVKIAEFFNSESKLKFEPMEYRGFTIYRPKTDEGRPNRARSKDIYFTAANSFFIYGNDLDEIKKVLRQIKGEGEGDITRNEDFRKATESLDPGYNSVVWFDFGRVFSKATGQYRTNPLLALRIAPLFDVSAMPSADSFGRFFGQFVAAAYSSRDSLRLKFSLGYPEGTRAR